jgi:hypothetical protein
MKSCAYRTIRARNRAESGRLKPEFYQTKKSTFYKLSTGQPASWSSVQNSPPEITPSSGFLRFIPATATVSLPRCKANSSQSYRIASCITGWRIRTEPVRP